MTQNISNKQLAEVVNRLLIEPEAAGELEHFESYKGFMTAVARVVCDFCGGEVSGDATLHEGKWCVGIQEIDSLPTDGGIWKHFKAKSACDQKEA